MSQIKNITKLRKQYHGQFTYGLHGRLLGLENGHYKIVRLKRLNKDGDVLVITKFGNKTKRFKFDFAGDKL